MLDRTQSWICWEFCIECFKILSLVFFASFESHLHFNCFIKIVNLFLYRIPLSKVQSVFSIVGILNFIESIGIIIPDSEGTMNSKSYLSEHFCPKSWAIFAPNSWQFFLQNWIRFFFLSLNPGPSELGPLGILGVLCGTLWAELASFLYEKYHFDEEWAISFKN